MLKVPLNSSESINAPNDPYCVGWALKYSLTHSANWLLVCLHCSARSPVYRKLFWVVWSKWTDVTVVGDFCFSVATFVTHEVTCINYLIQCSLCITVCRRCAVLCAMLTVCYSVLFIRKVGTALMSESAIIPESLNRVIVSGNYAWCILVTHSVTSGQIGGGGRSPSDFRGAVLIP